MTSTVAATWATQGVSVRKRSWRSPTYARAWRHPSAASASTCGASSSAVSRAETATAPLARSGGPGSATGARPRDTDPSRPPAAGTAPALRHPANHRSRRHPGTERRRSDGPGRIGGSPRARTLGARWCSDRTRSAPSSRAPRHDSPPASALDRSAAARPPPRDSAPRPLLVYYSNGSRRREPSRRRPGASGRSVRIKP